MHKIVINTDYGGFSLSQKAVEWLNAHGQKIEDGYDLVLRTDPFLVECVETLGKDASGEYAHLEVVEFEGDRYRIREYDGWEWVETPDMITWDRV